MNTREVVRELLMRMESGEPEDIAGLFATDVDFTCAGRAPWISPRKTREDMADFFAGMGEAFVPEARHAEVSSIIVDGDDAVVTGRVGQRLRSNDVAFEIPFALHLTVTPDGEIKRYHVYEDSLTVAESVAG